MLEKILRAVERFIPKRIYRFFQPYYHILLALIGRLYYRFPSRKMIVIAVTGTKGKTSTANFIWAALSGAGYKVGSLTTANIRIGDKEMPNNYHMTMPGRLFVQRMLRDFVDAGCTYAVIEITSEGIKQFRHLGIAYDIAVFTNLSPEHLPSHNNNFEEYKKAKGRLFSRIAYAPKKNLSVVQPNAIIVNADDPHADYYASFPAREHVTYGLHYDPKFHAYEVEEWMEGVSFKVGERRFQLQTVGAVNVYNALPAVAVARLCGLDDEDIQEGFSKLKIIPGRMEIIDEGQPFTVIVDYAHEGVSMSRLAEYADSYRRMRTESKWIVMVGAEGGGRDKRKRKDMGLVIGEHADIVVLSSTDPYEEDPLEILEDIAQYVEEKGKVRNENEFIEVERRNGIKKCFLLARPGDLVTITGNGSQAFMIIQGRHIPFDDRKVARELLGEMGYRKTEAV